MPGEARTGEAWRGLAWPEEVWRGRVRQVSRRRRLLAGSPRRLPLPPGSGSGRGKAWMGRARPFWQWLGKVRFGMEGGRSSAGFDSPPPTLMAWCGMARSGMAGRGRARPGWVRFSSGPSGVHRSSNLWRSLTSARRGAAWLCAAGHGPAGLGMGWQGFHRAARSSPGARPGRSHIEARRDVAGQAQVRQGVVWQGMGFRATGRHRGSSP